MGSLEDYWSGIGKWLQIQAQTFNRLIQHNGEMGRANELTVTDFLEKLLPENLGVSSGLLMGMDGVQSRQCDLVVHERHRHPRLFAQTSQFVYPVDTVVMTVEVKTTIDADEVASIGRQTASVRATKAAQNGRLSPFTCVFAFATSASAETTLKWFNTLTPTEQPDLVCIVGPGLLLSSNGATMSGEAVLLHVRDASHVRKSHEWRDAAATGSSEIVDGEEYPTSSLRIAGSKSRKVFDPGRALLLFSVRVLAALGSRDQLGTEWWATYLDKTTGETLAVTVV